MTDDPLDAMKWRWSYIQGYLFPSMREDIDPITEALGRLVTALDVIGLEAFVPDPPRAPGRPPEDRRALARAFVAKAVLGIPTTSALIERLDVDKSLRRILGWERRSQVPSEATFSRAFAEFARAELPDKIHATLIDRALGGRVVGAIARDATEIEAREKPIQNKAIDGKDDPPAPENPSPPRKRGRPRKGEERPKPEPTRIERQVTQTLGQMLADLPTDCDVERMKPIHMPDPRPRRAQGQMPPDVRHRRARRRSDHPGRRLQGRPCMTQLRSPRAAQEKITSLTEYCKRLLGNRYFP